MKKLYFSLFLLGLFFLLTSSVERMENAINSSSFLTMFNDSLIPELPEVPFEYKMAEFPQHIIDGMQSWEPVDPAAVLNNISNDGATLGRVLFYDKMLSADRSLSCASCHKQEFSFGDDVAFSEGINGTLTTRNSPNLNDIEWAFHFPFFIIVGNPVIFEQDKFLFWDGRVASLDSLVLLPVINQDELASTPEVIIGRMENSDYYPELFEKAFGSSEVTEERISVALGQFVRSMMSFDSKFDQAMMADDPQSVFTEQEMAGRLLFDQECGFCHAPPHFGSLFPANNGLDMEYEDGGMAEWLNDPMLAGSFKSPSLRNIAVTAPYMHDGRFETLEEVVDFYSDDVQPHPLSAFEWLRGPNFTGFDFSDTQKEDLIAFLNTLTDESFLTDEKWSDPFVPVVFSESPFLPFEASIQVFPNPFKEQTTIEIANPDRKAIELRLTTTTGQVLNTVTLTGEQHQLNRSDFPAGVYLLEVRSGNKLKTVRLVMQ